MERAWQKRLKEDQRGQNGIKKENQAKEGLTGHGKEADFGVFRDGPVTETPVRSLVKELDLTLPQVRVRMRQLKTPCAAAEDRRS